MPEEEQEQGTHGYYFRDLDGSWRFLAPYRSEFRDAISSEIPQKSRHFDWKYKIWIISDERFADAMDIAGRYFSMTQLFAVGVGQRRDLSMMERLADLQTLLRQTEQRLSQARDKITDLTLENTVLKRASARAGRQSAATPRMPDHSKTDCLKAVKRAYQEEATFHILPDAPNTVLTAAYRAMSMASHPDRNPGRRKTAEEDQKRLNLAYETLKKARGM